jgi:peptidoglycan/LPS O-acetylase OafA/YrhL
MVLAALAFSRSSSRLIAILAWAPIAFLGEISFGVYLWHGPILKALIPFDVLSHGYLLAFAELYGLSAALATVTYFLVERPALRRKRRWIATEKAPASG